MKFLPLDLLNVIAYLLRRPQKIRKSRKRKFVPAKPCAGLTTSEVIRMLRELKEWTQGDLAKRSGITATNISLLENGKVEIGKRRAEQLAEAFKVHPAIIMFPEYEAKAILKAA
jgi:DNA-binding XRE family transcriptional regulator